MREEGVGVYLMIQCILLGAFRVRWTMHCWCKLVRGNVFSALEGCILSYIILPIIAINPILSHDYILYVLNV